MNAVPMIQTCAAHQWPPDVPMLRAFVARSPSGRRDEPIGPNLILRTAPACTDDCEDDCEAHSGLNLPVLTIREG